jgi:hypothetical protein
MSPTPTSKFPECIGEQHPWQSRAHVPATKSNRLINVTLKLVSSIGRWFAAIGTGHHRGLRRVVSNENR